MPATPSTTAKKSTKPAAVASTRRARTVWSRASQAHLVQEMIEAREPFTPDAIAQRLTANGFYANSTGRTFSAQQVASKARQLSRKSGGRLRQPFSARITSNDIDAMIEKANNLFGEDT